MKKIIITLIVLLNSCSTPDNFYISPLLTKHYKDFIKDCKNSDIDVSEMKNLGFLGYTYLPPYYLGITIYDNEDSKDYIIINNKIENDTLVSLVLYHELTHFILKEDHCNKDDPNCAYLFLSGSEINRDTLFMYPAKHKQGIIKYIKYRQNCNVQKSKNINR